VGNSLAPAGNGCAYHVTANRSLRLVQMQPHPLNTDRVVQRDLMGFHSLPTALEGRRKGLRKQNKIRAICRCFFRAANRIAAAVIGRMERRKPSCLFPRRIRSAWWLHSMGPERCIGRGRQGKSPCKDRQILKQEWLSSTEMTQAILCLPSTYPAPSRRSHPTHSTLALLHVSADAPGRPTSAW
jgi:hypothetical protein